MQALHQTPGRRGIVIGLLASACIHLAVVANVDWAPRREPGAEAQDLRLLRVALTPGRAENPAGAVPPQAAAPTPEPPEASQGETVVAQKAGNPPPSAAQQAEVTVITRAHIRAALKHTVAAINEPGASTANGAIVMTPVLLEQLNAASRQVTGTEAGPGSTAGFQGGTWIEHLQLGDRCFTVHRADPLDALSADTWYRVSCD